MNMKDIFIEISKYNYKSGMRINDSILPINYGGTLIYFIYEKIFLYAIKDEESLYIFDIRDVAKFINYNIENDWLDIIINKRDWLSKFFNFAEVNSYLVHFKIDN